MNALNSNSRRGAAVVFVTGFALVATIVTAAAFNGRADDGGAPPSAPVATPAPSEAPVVTPAPVPSETPVDPATPAPTETPAVPTDPPVPTETPAESDDPDPEPTDGGSDGMPIKVDLENVTGNDVYVDIVDLGGTLVDAVSGDPGDGMSVEPYTLKVENVDERTLRLTWVDYAIDNALALYIHGDADRLVLVQPEPTEPTDAMAFDRELILTFDHAVSADDVEAFLQDGMDTPGE
jgi:hypothetical protein